MRTTAVRLYGKNDLRLESFELPPIREDEILARVISDGVCMSSHKAAILGAAHKRVPADIADNPVIIGHEFCGELVEVGAAWRGKFSPGDRFCVQPAVRDPSDPYATPGYSYRYIGGCATYVVIPPVVIERDCLLRYGGEAFFMGSLAEPVSCVIGGFRSVYHTDGGSRGHIMGIVPGGCMALLGGAGPMGMCAVDYALRCGRKPGLLVVTDVDVTRLARAASFYPVSEAGGVDLRYISTKDIDDIPAALRALTPDGRGYDDVFVYAPVESLVEQAAAVLAVDGCLNFFAGPTDTGFSARLNFYDVHYNSVHVAGNSGGDASDMLEAIDMIAMGLINPAAMITHVGGLDSAAGATLRLPEIPGGKKLIYTHLSMPLTAISELGDKVSPELGEIVAGHGGLWSARAERWLLQNGRRLTERAGR